MPRKASDLTGQKIGHWNVQNRDHSKASKWICICDCGVYRSIPRCNLTRGLTTNCGCKQKEKTRLRMMTHGKSKTKLYGVWLAMRRRCYLKSSSDYLNWGGRGIKVCDLWRYNYSEFEKWAYKSGYREGLTIERKDVNGNYSPQNCTWATRTQQVRNRTITKMLTINGVTKPLAQWAEEYGINKGTLSSRVGYGWQGEEVLIRSKGRGANGLNARNGRIERVQ
jgi:hypothetical protein